MYAPLSKEEHDLLMTQAPQDPNPEPGTEGGSGDKAAGSGECEANAVWNMVRDLHVELIFMYHRVCLKLAQIGAGE